MSGQRDPKTGRFTKGMTSVFLGRTHSEAAKLKMSLAKKGIPHPWQSNEKHPSWKGDDVGYKKLHSWIRIHFPPPKECVNCKQEKKVDLANITGIYNRDISNWKYLCRSCHFTLDKPNLGKKYRRNI